MQENEKIDAAINLLDAIKIILQDVKNIEDIMLDIAFIRKELISIKQERTNV